MLNKKIIVILLASVILCGAFVGCAIEKDVKAVVYAQTDTLQTIDIHTQRQNMYINSSPSSGTWYAKGKAEYSKPMPIALDWAHLSLSGESKKYTVSVSENENMKNAVSYETNALQLDLINLKIAKTYYWKVNSENYQSQIYKFDVADVAPRNISVDGVTNVRDLGGWKTQDGRRVKQGLVYRCGRLNKSSAKSAEIEITQNGIKTMTADLGIKSEIDLRLVYNGEIGAITSSPLGTGVKYINAPMEWDGNIFYDNKQELLKVFSIFADEDNYPLIFHCNIGTDRTGMVAYLINALSGVSQDDLMIDYLFSNLGNIGGSRKSTGITNSPYYKAIQNAQGNTWQQKTYSALVEYGVPSEQLDSIISIMLD